LNSDTITNTRKADSGSGARTSNPIRESTLQALKNLKRLDETMGSATEKLPTHLRFPHSIVPVSLGEVRLVNTMLRRIQKKIDNTRASFAGLEKHLRRNRPNAHRNPTVASDRPARRKFLNSHGKNEVYQTPDWLRDV
jgi:hypothetical protein